MLFRLKKEQLQSLADILGVSVTERNEENAERILNFLMAPVDDGKAIPERKMSMRTTKQYSTNSKESLPTDEDEFDDKAEVNPPSRKKSLDLPFRMTMMMMNYSVLMTKKTKKVMMEPILIILVVMKIVV